MTDLSQFTLSELFCIPAVQDLTTIIVIVVLFFWWRAADRAKDLRKYIREMRWDLATDTNEQSKELKDAARIWFQSLLTEFGKIQDTQKSQSLILNDIKNQKMHGAMLIDKAIKDGLDCVLTDEEVARLAYAVWARMPMDFKLAPADENPFVQPPVTDPVQPAVPYYPPPAYHPAPPWYPQYPYTTWCGTPPGEGPTTSQQPNVGGRES